MKKTALLILAMVGVFALSCSQVRAQTALAAPSIKWVGQWTNPIPTSPIGFDSGTQAPCIIGSTPTCALVTSNGGAGGAVTITPSTVTTTDKGGTLTTGGVAQTAIASNASRKGWCIQNSPAATETLYVRVNGTASASTGVALQPGQQACNAPNQVDTAAVSVFAATTAHAWFGSEVQ